MCIRAIPELAEWVTFMRATGAAQATIHIRIQVIQQLLRFVGVATPLLLTRRHVLAYLARDVQPWTLCTYYRSIAAWDKWAQEFDYINESIVRGIPAPKRPKGVPRPLTDEEIRTLLAAPIGRRPRAYVTLGLFAGMRVHEVARIRGQDLDHEAGWLRIKGKGGVTDSVPIHPRVGELAMSYPEIGFWFTRATDARQSVDPQAVSATVKNVMVQLGINATAHQLRDSLATKLQREQGDLTLVQAMLRHADVSTSMKYTKIANTRLQYAVMSLDWNHAA